MVMLGHGFPVSASFEITAQWLDAPHGAIRLPKPDEEIIGSHCVGIVGFDLIHRFFRFENSWGGDWGDAGYGYLPFEYFDKYLVSSWLPHGIGKFPDYYRVSGVAELVWGVPDFLGHTLHGGDIIHGREVYDGANDERLGWAFAVHREGYLDVEEIFVRPQFRKAGVANRLVSMLLELAGDVNRPLRLWVPFADWTASNSSGVEKIVGKLGLRLHETNVRWAAAVAIAPGVPPPASPSSVVPQAKFASHPVPPGSVALSKRTPKRPAKCRPGRSALPAGEPRRDRYPLRGKPVRYVDPTSPVAESEWESPR